jgi:hypothetical protein
MGSSVRPHPGRLVLALLLIQAAAGCSGGDGDPAPTPPPRSSAVVPTSVPGRFTGFADPCPTVRGRAGTQQSSVALSTGTVVNCVYGDRSRFPKFASRTTLSSPPASSGTPDAVAQGLFRGSKVSDRKDATTFEDLAGLGDEAYLLINSRNRLTWLVIRSANVLIAVSGQVDIYGAEAERIADLKALRPQVTELAKALLAELE